MNDDLSQDKLDSLFDRAEGGDPIAVAELVRRFGPLIKRDSTIHGCVSGDLRQDMHLLLVRKLREHLMTHFETLEEENNDEE
ncbi:MAG: helix-turn-helix domain-containing protein [Bacilli bacterium]